MTFRTRSILPPLLAIAAIVALAGCGSSAASATAALKTPAPATATASSDASPTEPPSIHEQGPQWLFAEFTDVSTGEKFTISGLGGVVLVQGMAQWCPTCKSQAGELKKLAQAFGEDGGLTIVSLDVDVNEDAASLKAYAAAAGFDWRFAVGSADVLREIGNLYGSQYLNPPSAPMLLVTLTGDVLPLPAGVKSAQTLQETITGYLGV